MRAKIYQSGRFICEIEGRPGETLLRGISRAGLFLDAPCGGEGRCGKCKVGIGPGSQEVLACQTHISKDMEISLPGLNYTQHEPLILNSQFPILNSLGVAIDIGTTTIAAYLIALETGERLAAVSSINPQRTYGADVISRIRHCAENGHKALTELIRGHLAALTMQMCAAANVGYENIKIISIAANTIMQHLAAGYSPVSMGKAPFTPVSLFGEETALWEGFPAASGARIYYTPAIAAYIGGDITAGLLASGLWDDSQLTTHNSQLSERINARLPGLITPHSDGGCALYLDIGTNGEIVLLKDGIYYCCAAAAGPAFEGAEIEMGMAAVEGAISRIEWDGETSGLKLTVIGDVPPVGICGSGLIDVLAVMLETGVLDETGRLDNNSQYTIHSSQLPGLPDIYITAQDVRKLQLAKAAIAAGIQTLLHHAGITESGISRLILAGGFGSYLDKYSAAAIGLFPESLLPVTHVLGNTAGEGAALALCSEAVRQTMEDIRSRCRYIELSSSRVFNEQFIEQMTF